MRFGTEARFLMHEYIVFAEVRGARVQGRLEQMANTLGTI